MLQAFVAVQLRPRVVTKLLTRENQYVHPDGAALCGSIRKAVIILRSKSILLAAGVLPLAVSACGVGFPPDFPAPPRNAPIVLPVKVSPGGRVITVRAAKPCGHRPLLIARSYPDRVTLRLVNRDISNCHAEAVGVITVSVTLPNPLGSRKLVQALTGKMIKYHIGHF